MGKRGGYWPKHPDKDLQAVLVVFNENEWEIIRGNGYYKMRCPCGAHKLTLHLSPSNPNHGKEKIQQMKRTDCYRESQQKEAP